MASSWAKANFESLLIEPLYYINREVSGSVLGSDTASWRSERTRDVEASKAKSIDKETEGGEGGGGFVLCLVGIVVVSNFGSGTK